MNGTLTVSNLRATSSSSSSSSSCAMRSSIFLIILVTFSASWSPTSTVSFSELKAKLVVLTKILYLSILVLKSSQWLLSTKLICISWYVCNQGVGDMIYVYQATIFLRIHLSSKIQLFYDKCLRRHVLIHKYCSFYNMTFYCLYIEKLQKTLNS